jgi:hypothetical protein
MLRRKNWIPDLPLLFLVTWDREEHIISANGLCQPIAHDPDQKSVAKIAREV